VLEQWRSGFSRQHSSHLDHAEQERRRGGELDGAEPNKICDQLNQTGALRNAIAKARDHPLFESGVGFLAGECFVKNFVHIFFLLKGLAAVRAVDEVRMKRIAFRGAQLAVEIGGE
jgi:hypothetical protein